MRLNLYLRGIDLLDIEFHAGRTGVSVDFTVFQPRDESSPSAPDEHVRDLSGTPAGSYERVDGPVWDDDQPAVVHAFGFGKP